MKNDPKVSVLIPTYNRANMISKAINSVLEQDYDNIEIIVADDGSTDNTKDVICKNYSQYMVNNEYGKTLHYYYSDFIGIPGVRNLALKHATGEYIAFCDSDDYWHPNKLRIQIDFFKENPSCQIVFSEFDNVYATDTDFVPTEEQKNIMDNWEYCMYILPSCVKKELFDIYGNFDNDFFFGDDFEWAVRLKICGVCMDYMIPQVLYYRTIHNKNISLNYANKDDVPFYSIVLKAMRKSHRIKRRMNNGYIRIDTGL